MSETVSWLLPLAEGLLIGALFFGGLCWTVHRGISSQRPALWFLFSMLVRMSLALLGFYLVGREHWQQWIACLIGFTLARLLLQHGWRLPRAAHAP